MCSLGDMAEKRNDKNKRSTPANLWRLALMVIGAFAIITELRKPTAERTWHGKVADFVPYDFRMPNTKRIRETYWNPDGPIMSSKLWGVGWTLNIGALKQRFGA